MPEGTEKIKLGDVVQLKSGGPLMTVDEIYGDDKFAQVSWFPTSQSEKVCVASFAINVLKPSQYS